MPKHNKHTPPLPFSGIFPSIPSTFWNFPEVEAVEGTQKRAFFAIPVPFHSLPLPSTFWEFWGNVEGSGRAAFFPFHITFTPILLLKVEGWKVKRGVRRAL